jgi:hypothetical protein
LNFYLIIITSEKKIADDVLGLKNLVIMAQRKFDDYGFITAGMTPTDALDEARRLKNERDGMSELAAPTSDLSSGD